ncbi:bifunctional 2-polyprenyl-6-hydroxyphenol methylase/3-demethylubiquinol 3-O-methyltransferase UbiG [Fodinicurvata sediminis]|uniref:bifunctional 2-polyprenyl-6-hydroxyphenol methylase/3-demethylubiquinol 3-O-methyltransferase UbiG n=1 Tax=Fodinicurvata sediminis TaxID=1121832 RepID=UPI0003B55A7B|nr:bifunctional 2-polyprenyl-6-hydroxyphenol methylase/3-demethylubiquinol 3-O-methyltransferase UbiG [Fodinicurvata sediminis]
MSRGHSSSTVDPSEIDKFSAMAEAWWDEQGDFAPLHRQNPTRLSYIREQACTHFQRDPRELTPLKGLRVLDIGCGGGLLCEPLARLGAQVTGIDASEKNIAVARLHAEQCGLEIDYRCIAAENLAETGEVFDIVLAMEIVEHVADVPAFLDACASLLDKDGAFFLSTLNRTTKSFMLAIVGAEYLLRWLPRGTHDWKRFLRPSEVTRQLRQSNMEVRDLAGMVYNPLNDSWRLSRRDLEVNYLLYGQKLR